MSVMQVEIVGVQAPIFSGEAEMLFAPAVDGEVGILPNHMPFLTQLNSGEVVVRSSGEDTHFFITKGFLRVRNNKAVVLADTVVRAKDLDEAKIQEAKQRAENLIATANSDFDVAKAESEVATAIAQLKLLNKLKGK